MCVVNVVFAAVGLLSLLAGSLCFISQEPLDPAKEPTIAPSHCYLSFFTIPLGVIMVPISLAVTIIACLGCLSTGRYDKCAMKAYCVILTVMLILMVWLIFILGIYNIYSNNRETREFLQKVLKHFYDADNDIFTKTMNYIMVNYKCCGFVNYRDFNETRWIKRNETAMFPLQCCKMRSITYLERLNEICPNEIKEEPEEYSNKDFGCYEALRRSIIDNILWVWVAMGAVLVYYSFVICSTYVVLCGSMRGPIKGGTCGNNQSNSSVTKIAPELQDEISRKLFKLVPDSGQNPNIVFYS